MQGVFESFFPFHRTLKPELGAHNLIETCHSLLRDSENGNEYGFIWEL